MPGPGIGVTLPSMSMPRELPGDVVAAARHAEDLGEPDRRASSFQRDGLTGGDWHRQTELLAEAVLRLQ